jgi:hypothetical protein
MVEVADTGCQRDEAEAETVAVVWAAPHEVVFLKHRKSVCDGFGRQVASADHLNER